MLRECRRVLAPNGRIAGYVIHTPDGLNRDEEVRAAELGPPDVCADAGPAQLARQAGFDVTFVQDVTDAFRSACLALLRAREEHAPQLRSEEGDEVFEHERSRKQQMLKGIEAGLLRRSLIVAVRP